MSMLERFGFDPFRDLMSIQGELNRLFGRTFGGGETIASGAWIPAVGVYESADKIAIAVELSGIELEVPKREEAKPRKITVRAK